MCVHLFAQPTRLSAYLLILLMTAGFIESKGLRLLELN